MESNIHHHIRCAEIWGGITAVDQDVSTSSLAISIYSSPCQGEAGGDIYYVSVCGGDQLTRIAIADLQGHGEQVSGMSRRIYQSLVDHLGDLDNAIVLGEMNRFAIEQGYGAMTTAVVVSFLLQDGALSYTYAGHPPVLLKRSKGADWSAILLPNGNQGTNPSLGVFPDAHFEQGTLPLAAGDRFCVYTDGVTDCPSPGDQPFGVQRLRDVLSRYDDQPPAAAKAGIVEELRAHADGPLKDDDTTLLIVEVSVAA
jgi:sigma-B regulation protein RsbU (phosphoserine phosphatase)